MMLTSDFHMKAHVCIGTPSHTHIKKSQPPGDVSSPPLPQGQSGSVALTKALLWNRSIATDSEGLRAHIESTLSGPHWGPGEASAASPLAFPQMMF